MIKVTFMLFFSVRVHPNAILSYQLSVTNGSDVQIGNRGLSLKGPLKRPQGLNRSPKGNMWSAIPVALLYLIVNLSEGSRAAVPKGTKSCRTQGDFR